MKPAFLSLPIRPASLTRSVLVQSRWPVFLARALTLAGFVLTILTGLFGSVVGSHNFAIIFVWIAWWTLLKLFFIPFGGRAWCAICPIPMPGEWLSQGSIFPPGAPGQRKYGLGLKWPRKFGPLRLDGAWLQAGGFLLIGLFSAATLTTPRLTGWVLLAIFALATGLAVLFEGREVSAGSARRVFCNHLCPIGGFTGLYALAAPVEVRVLDTQICAAHKVKTCYQACPWGVYIAAVQDNGPCGMCFECVRICPNENVAVNLRAFGKDFAPASVDVPALAAVGASRVAAPPKKMVRRALRLDEVYLALVMLGCGLVFSAVFLGPWGWLRRAAYNIGSPEWFIYSACFLLLAGLVVPGLYGLAVWAGRSPEKSLAWQEALRSAARPLLPLGFCAWVAFTISFALAKAAYILPVLADPFGRGWNLLQLASTSASVVVAGPVVVIGPLLQGVVLLGGLLWAGRIARRELAPRLAGTVQAFTLTITLGMMVLLIG